VEVWKTVFYQQLTGDDAVLDWVSGTALRPILEGLDEGERERFVTTYRAKLGVAYPQEPDGTTIYPFPRLFIVGSQE
jgi:trans-aconitate 2-methyltransferase